MSYNNYTYQSRAIAQVSVPSQEQRLWSGLDIYEEGCIVNYEGLRYMAIRSNMNEIPLLCESGAWEPHYFYQQVKPARSIGFGNDNVLSFVDTQFLEYQIKEDIKLTLKEFSFKGIKAFNTREDKICSRLFLSGVGANGTQLQWESSDQGYLTNQGSICRPEKAANKWIRLKLTVSKGDFYGSKFFDLCICAKEA